MQAKETTFYFSAVLRFENGRETQEFHSVTTNDIDVAFNVVIDDINERWPNRLRSGSILNLTEFQYNSLRSIKINSMLKQNCPEFSRN